MRLMITLMLLLLPSAVTFADDNAENNPTTETPAAESNENGEAKQDDDDADEQEPESLRDLLKRIEQAHQDNKDFAGNFEQERYLPLFGDTIRSSGRFAFKQPDKVRWEYARPHRSILVVEGDRGRKWSAGTNRVESFRLADDRGLDAVVNQLFTWFRGEFSKLDNDYDVELVSREPLKLKLTPKREALQRFIQNIEITLDSKEVIESVKLIEPLQPGDEAPGHTLYRFKDTKLDEGVDDDEFQINR
jgi:outer membrane lipoprotein-sorting protein